MNEEIHDHEHEIEIPTWDNMRRSLSDEPTHDWGIGCYYKKIGTAADERGFFAFVKAAYNERFHEEPIVTANGTFTGGRGRCDASAPKVLPTPVDLHETDEETGLCIVCGSDKPVYGTTRSHIASLGNMLALRAPFNGYKGFIVHIVLTDPELEHEAFVLPQNTARTLQELFKLMLEWDWVYRELGSEDVHAVLAHNILEELEMPESIKNWLWEAVPDMRVAKFFKNQFNARERPSVESIPDMSVDFDNWCWHHIAMKPRIYHYLPH